MIATGIPELTKKEDINYMRDRLNLHMTDDEAAEHFKEQIPISLHTKRFAFFFGGVFCHFSWVCVCIYRA